MSFSPLQKSLMNQHINQKVDDFLDEMELPELKEKNYPTSTITWVASQSNKIASQSHIQDLLEKIKQLDEKILSLKRKIGF